MRHFCTYFDVNYLTRGLVLHQSLTETGADFTLWALCLDEASLRAITQLSLPGLVPVALEELERYDPALVDVKPQRSRVEYYFTLTPSLPLYLLDRERGIDVISYLDADLRFYASPDLVLNDLKLGSVLIIPHGFPESLEHLEKFGKYNVGMVSFRNDAAGRACLVRWRSQCLEWCYDRFEQGRFADQAYLDDWPEAIPGTVVVDRPGVGLAPWNFMRYSIDVSTPSISVDGMPLVFYHYHLFRGVAPGIYDDGLRIYGRMPRSVRAALYGGYVRDLRAARRLSGHAAGTTPGSIRLASVRWRDVLGLARARRLLYEVGDRVIG
jgi:hypothetical protein